MPEQARSKDFQREGQVALTGKSRLPARQSRD
jgi:hypothetical protein